MSTSPRANRGPAAAAENRASIIRAAGEVFAEKGLNAPYSAIAKRAGVGQGSLYRNFPTRQSLAFVAFDDNLTQIEAAIARGGTLADVLTMISEQAAASAAFIELIAQHPDDPHAATLGARVAGIVEATIDEGRRSGTIPATFTVADVLVAIQLVAGGASVALVSDRVSLVRRGWQLLGIRLD
ncbi:TetR/AcrR family transcriptional regulator [soil metagenome]